jgi:plasmid stabilization system protein ParE
MKEVIIKSRVYVDIMDYAEYMDSHNPESGDKFIDAAFDAFEELSRFSFIGKPLDSDNPKLENIRIWRVKKFEQYLIFYKATKDSVDILRIFHSKMNFIVLLELDFSN